MKKLLNYIAISIIALTAYGCSTKNEPEKETGQLTVVNDCNYYATANVFLTEGDSEKEILEFDIPANGSVTQTLEVGSYRVFARCRTSLYFVSENCTISKGSIVTISITK